MTTYYLSPKSNYYFEEAKYYKNGAELKAENVLKKQNYTEVTVL